MAFDELITTNNQNQLSLYGAVSSLKKELDLVGVHQKEEYNGFFEQLKAYCQITVSSLI